MLSDPLYFQAIFHNLSAVKNLYRAQAELGMANEAIARMLDLLDCMSPTHLSSENNLSFQQQLYDLRSETKAAFDDAKALEARWKELEKEQKEVYQVSWQLQCRQPF